MFYTTKCRLEIGSYGIEDTKNMLLRKKSTRNFIDQKNEYENPYSQYDKPINLNGIQGGDKEKWEVLSRELAQKQELIHRMIKEIDDKTDALKITGTEIVDLRRQIKLLQSENEILRKRLGNNNFLGLIIFDCLSFAVVSAN